ncbi:hypothetical protein BJX65DRAFT_315112 [Aspergillus insuetus]
MSTMDNSDLDALFKKLANMERGGLDQEMINHIFNYCESKNGILFWETESRDGYDLSDIAIRSLIKVADRDYHTDHRHTSSMDSDPPSTRHTYKDPTYDPAYDSTDDPMDDPTYFPPHADPDSDSSMATVSSRGSEQRYPSNFGVKRRHKDSSSDAPSTIQRTAWAFEKPVKRQRVESPDPYSTRRQVNASGFGGMAKRPREESPDFQPSKRHRNQELTEEQRRKQNLFFGSA